MADDIDQMVDRCQSCLSQRNAPAREPLVCHDVPSRAWQKVGMDLFTYKGVKYQIIVDYFSKFPEVAKLPLNPVSRNLIDHCKMVFGRFGITEIIMSDNEQVYVSREFANFCENYEIYHDTSSPRYPQSNGFVERQIQFVKNTIIKCSRDNSDINIALLQLRNTPISSELPSPAYLLFNRNIRTKLPCVEEYLTNKEDLNNREFLLKRQKLGKEYYDRTANHDSRTNFNPGDLVVYRDQLADRLWKHGKVISQVDPRSYKIVSSSGAHIRRNSRMLLPDKTRDKLTIVPPDLDHTKAGASMDPARGPSHVALPPSRIHSKIPSNHVTAAQQEPARRSQRLKETPRMDYKAADLRTRPE